MFGYLGSRGSSIDETRRHESGEDVTKEDETVMDSEQGNSTSFQLGKRLVRRLANSIILSALPYHISAEAWRRFEQSDAAYIYPRTTIDAGAHNKVCSTPTRTTYDHVAVLTVG